MLQCFSVSSSSTRIALAGTALAVLLAGCATAPSGPTGPAAGSPATPRGPFAFPSPTPSSKYYADDGPPVSSPADLDKVPDAVPKLEPLHRFANRPYTVLGRDYVPATMLRPYRERGVASWYGRKFHGQKTSIGEVYDMFAMTAAHPTLPLPSYARVTNATNGRSVVVRVNDRGPFLHGRIIDLSYAAATRLEIAQRGSGEVIVESIMPADAGPSVARPLPPVADPAVATGPLASQPPVVAEPAPAPALPGGFVVQLGAFANFANAQTFLAHVQNQTAAAQVEPRVRQSQGLWRVYVGPYTERDEARRVAERIASAFGLATTVGVH
jgi:rare lipoprotein A